MEFEQPPATRRARKRDDIDALPSNDEPYWFRVGHPLANHQSSPELPGVADVLVIGAGLTGASAAYHLSAAARSGQRIVVLDQGDPASEASGRNGGNFELIPENSVGIYEGLARERLAFLQRVYRTLPIEVLHAESERQASAVLGLALRNRDLLKNIVLKERIDCDFSPRGWLHLASSELEEEGICEEVTLAAQHGQRLELWSRRKIREEFGIENEFLGRFIPGDGTYHPFKYVNGLLKAALAAGVQLYTRTAVTDVRSEGADQHHVITARGTIIAKRVIVATNAFTSRLFPELRRIVPYQSQVMVTEDAPDRARGRICTCEEGPVFFNQPRSGARNGTAPLLMGGGADRPMKQPSSRRRSVKVHRQLIAMRDRFYPELKGRLPSTEWIGPMAFTPDQLPAIGFLRPGIVIAAGYNGYGGSYTTAAGAAAVEMALTSTVPDWVPVDIFSPRRLLSTEPLFMTERDSLWRIAASLCRQLKAVNRRISEAFTLHEEAASSVDVRRSRMMTVIAEPVSASTIPPEEMIAFPIFSRFTVDEMQTLLAAMSKWELRRGTTLFIEGSPGGTCFVVVSGTVDVSIEVNQAHQLLARLPAGNVIGHVSLIDGQPRSATCTVYRDAVLVELGRQECAALLQSGSALALKLLAVLNEGLVAALRNSDRQLMKLESQGVLIS